MRRVVAAAVAVIIVVFLVLVIHSCQISQRNSALKDYTDNVSTLMQSSTQTGTTLLHDLGGGSSATNATGLSTQVNELRMQADGQLAKAKSFDVPDEMRPAQQNVVFTLQMRDDAFTDIGTNIERALGNSTNQDAINSIAADMGHLYASDVVYTFYATREMASALNAASISIGGVNGITIAGSQLIANLQWLSTGYIASQLHVSLPVPQGKPAPGVHGHAMKSCSVGGTQLQTSSTNTIPASPPPTFTCQFTNDGQNPERNIVVKVTVSGTSVSGHTVIPNDAPGQTSTATVTLGSSPPAGSYTVTATVERVPGETVVTHNSLSFPVTFQ